MRVYKVWFSRSKDSEVFRYKEIEGMNNLNLSEKDDVENFGYAMTGYNTKYGAYVMYVDVDFHINTGVDGVTSKVKENLISKIREDKLNSLEV